VAFGIAYVVWRWLIPAPSPEPPAIALAEIDPQVAAAIEAARARVLVEPRSADAWGHLAMLLHVHDFQAEADCCYAQAERLAPREARWPYLRALALFAGNPHPGPGVQCLERAAAKGGEVSAPRAKLAEILLEQGRLEESERLFLQVLEQDPTDPRAHLGLGRVAHARRDWSLSRDHLQRSAARAPDVRATHVLLADVYHRLGEATAADEERDLAAKAPDDLVWADPFLEDLQARRLGVGPRVLRAEQLVRHQRGPEAIALLEQTVQEHPTSFLAYLALGRLCNQLGRRTEAESALQEAVRLGPSESETHVELGIALQGQQRYHEAAACYRRAIESKPNFALAYYKLGHCLLQEGDRAGAMKACRMAVRYRPDYALAHEALGILLAERGQLAEALEHLQHAARLDPADPHIKRSLNRTMNVFSVQLAP
jgi:tetratricopeptide (TPR) repeat protein